MNYRIQHKTQYSYTDTISFCHNEAWLVPRSWGRNRLDNFKVEIQPQPAAYREWEDFFGNRVLYFAIQQAHKKLTIHSTSHVTLQPWDEKIALKNRMDLKGLHEFLKSDLSYFTQDSRPFLLDSPMVEKGKDFEDYAKDLFPQDRPVIDGVVDLVDKIFKNFKYDPGATTSTTRPEDALKLCRGVCQDFAHVAIGCLRSLGIPARYVSGYIETLPPPGKKRLIGADATHAWFSFFLPETGWVDMDPTNNQIVGNRHILTAWGRDYSDIPPIKGVVFGNGAHTLEVSVDVLNLKS